MGFPDPDELDRIATRIEGKADEVRTECTTFREQVANAIWQSKKQKEYQQECNDLRLALLSDANGLDAAAAALRSHATSVRNRIEWIQDRIDDLENLAREGIEITQEMIDDLGEFGSEVKDEIEDRVSNMLDDLGDVAGDVKDGLVDGAKKVIPGI